MKKYRSYCFLFDATIEVEVPINEEDPAAEEGNAMQHAIAEFNKMTYEDFSISCVDFEE